MNKSRRFKIEDILLIAGIILPVAIGIVIKVLFTPQSEDSISITGALVYFTIPLSKLGLKWDLPISEAQVNSWLVIISVFFLCLFMTHGINAKSPSRRQHIAEWAIEKIDKLVQDNMGNHFMGYSPFIIAMMALSALSSLMTLFGLFPPTSDLNVIAGWAILVFILITYYKLKCGLLNYLKGFTQPIPVFTPFNILGEFSTPLSMTFRHYGNIVSGTVISALLAAALKILSNAVFGWLPGKLGEFPFFRIGLPAVFSVYFDVFSGCIQAFIFAMLTMLNVSSAFDYEDYQKRQAKRLAKLARRQNQNT